VCLYHGAASAEHVGDALENVGEMRYWHTHAS
jgi:hypothetical protein